MGTEELLRGLDLEIDAAVDAVDTAPLERILSGDYVYLHANNKRQTKREYIEMVTGLDDAQRRVLSEIEVEPHEDVAVTRGNLDIIYRDGRPPLLLRYVRVYRQQPDGIWRAISHRTAPAADRSPQQ